MIYRVVETNNTCPLTGLPTGAALESAIDRFLSSDTVDRWILYIRIDQILAINETYGRDEGDAVIQHTAAILSRLTPGTLYRDDGPMFVTVLTGDTSAALALGEEYRSTIFESTEFVEPITVSIALITADEGSTHREIDGIARKRLQNARRRGGNVVSAVSTNDGEDDRSIGTVLIVDPDLDHITVLINEIEARGVNVITTDDGLDALQIVSQFAPDVVITEISVPKIGGFELRSRLRKYEQLSDIAFIVLSHRQTDDLIREAASLQILHYFKKPESALLIAELVSNLIRGNSSSVANR